MGSGRGLIRRAAAAAAGAAAAAAAEAVASVGSSALVAGGSFVVPQLKLFALPATGESAALYFGANAASFVKVYAEPGAEAGGGGAAAVASAAAAGAAAAAGGAVPQRLIFESSDATPLLILHSGGEAPHVEVAAPEFVTNALKLNGELVVGSVPQWRMVHSEALAPGGSVFGWDGGRTDLVTECANIPMLGGYGVFSKGEIAKRFDLAGLPHSQVRVKANFHFIDQWSGETGFARADVGRDGSLVHVWTDTYDAAAAGRGVNVCGRADVPEAKFASPVDVVLEHQGDSIRVAFGSTLAFDDPAMASWGVSALEIYIR